MKLYGKGCSAKSIANVVGLSSQKVVAIYTRIDQTSKGLPFTLYLINKRRLDLYGSSNFSEEIYERNLKNDRKLDLLYMKADFIIRSSPKYRLEMAKLYPQCFFI